MIFRTNRGDSRRASQCVRRPGLPWRLHQLDRDWPPSSSRAGRSLRPGGRGLPGTGPGPAPRPRTSAWPAGRWTDRVNPCEIVELGRLTRQIIKSGGAPAPSVKTKRQCVACAHRSENQCIDSAQSTTAECWPRSAADRNAPSQLSTFARTRSAATRPASRLNKTATWGRGEERPPGRLPGPDGLAVHPTGLVMRWHRRQLVRRRRMLRQDWLNTWVSSGWLGRSSLAFL